MPVTDPTAVRFSNELIRPFARRMYELYMQARELTERWYAANMGAMFPINAGTVQDGAESDGRVPITANDVLLVVTRASELVADMTANNNAKLNTVAKPANFL